MANKDFREIQVSSSLLVVIFLGVLALGVFIFLLGVSVGKRQAGAGAPTQIVTQQIPEPVKEPAVKPAVSDDPGLNATGAEPAPSASSSGSDLLVSKAPVKETAINKPPAASPKPAAATKKAAVAAPTATGLWYVQVAAYTDRAQAQAGADKFRKQGYTAVVSNPKPSDAKTWYRVRLGGFPTRDRAQSLLDKLNAAAGKTMDYRIVQD